MLVHCRACAPLASPTDRCHEPVQLLRQSNMPERPSRQALLQCPILTLPAMAVQDHSDAVTAVTLHATGDYFVTASMDRTWAFYDVATGTCYSQAGPPCTPADCRWLLLMRKVYAHQGV